MTLAHPTAVVYGPVSGHEITDYCTKCRNIQQQMALVSPEFTGVYWPHFPPPRYNSCRIIGATTMLGVSAYGIFTRAQTPVSQRGHRAFLLGVSGIFAVAGIARATWPDKGQAVGALANPSAADRGDR